MSKARGKTAVRSVIAVVTTLIAVASVVLAANAASPSAAKPKPADTTPPPIPQITKMPQSTEDPQTAQFKLTNTEGGVSYRCSLDGSPFSPCSSTVNYNKLTDGQHCFQAKAVDAAGNQSSATQPYCWTVVSRRTYGISGSITASFVPGHTEKIDLTLGNPNNQPLTIDKITVDIDPVTNKPGCSGTTNFSVTKQFTGTVTIAKNTTRSLSGLGVDPSRWPEVTMLDLPTFDQDACKGATFKLNYTGTASQ